MKFLILCLEDAMAVAADWFSVVLDLVLLILDLHQWEVVLVNVR